MDVAAVVGRLGNNVTPFSSMRPVTRAPFNHRAYDDFRETYDRKSVIL